MLLHSFVAFVDLFMYDDMVFPQVKAIFYFNTNQNQNSYQLFDEDGRSVNNLSKTYLSCLDFNIPIRSMHEDKPHGYTRLTTINEVRDALYLAVFASYPGNPKLKVKYTWDGSDVATADAAPYSTVLKANNLSQGEHELKVTTNCLNTTYEQYFTVKVDNGKITAKEKIVDTPKVEKPPKEEVTERPVEQPEPKKIEEKPIVDVTPEKPIDKPLVEEPIETPTEVVPEVPTEEVKETVPVEPSDENTGETPADKPADETDIEEPTDEPVPEIVPEEPEIEPLPEEIPEVPTETPTEMPDENVNEEPEVQDNKDNGDAQEIIDSMDKGANEKEESHLPLPMILMGTGALLLVIVIIIASKKR